MSLVYKMILLNMKKTQKNAGNIYTGSFELIAKNREIMDDPKRQLPVEKDVNIESFFVENIPCERLTPKEILIDNAVLYYIHGGGYMYGNEKTSRGYGSALAKSLGIVVYTVGYRLAPEHPYPACTDDQFRVYKEIIKMHPNAKIGLVGESGGGTGVLTTALQAKTANIKLPEAIYAMNPMTSLDPDDDERLPSRKNNVKTDLVVPVANIAKTIGMYYVRDYKNYKDPILSPLYGDYTGFPPVKITVDISEVLYDDSKFLKDSLINYGVVVDYKELKGFFHSFPSLGNICPESKALMLETKAFFDKYLK